MLIGSQYADHKLYRGIEVYDSYPLTSGDILEYADTSYMKNAYIMNNLLGYGTMNTPMLSVKNGGITLSTPSVVMIDGDISLIQSDEGLPLVSIQDIKDAGYAEGTVCIVGWYQHLNLNSTLRNYGGVNNSILENDLEIEKFGLQVSTRYQLRWFPIIIDSETLQSDNISITIEDRDQHGDLLGTTSIVNSKEKNNSVFILEKPADMDYSESDLYLVPIFRYEYNNSAEEIKELHNIDTVSTGGAPFIVSEVEPTNIHTNGARWYNPITREFKTYVAESGGFVDTASKMAFLQYQSIHVIDQQIDTPQNIVVPIDISSFQEGDILRVIYEGLELVNEVNYTIDYENNSITLLDFTTYKGDMIYFNVTRVVEASDITNITEIFTRHMDSTASSTVEAHVKLSDTISNSGVSGGIAATPKMVSIAKEEAIESSNSATSSLLQGLTESFNESLTNLDDKVNNLSSSVNESLDSLGKEISEISGNINHLVDDTTKVHYKLGIDNGLLYIEEV